MIATIDSGNSPPETANHASPPSRAPLEALWNPNNQERPAAIWANDPYREERGGVRILFHAPRQSGKR
jgi:hypothetical protein